MKEDGVTLVDNHDELHPKLEGDAIVSIGNNNGKDQKMDEKDIASVDEDSRRDKLLCNICNLEPQDQAVVIPCGHFFCESCLMNEFESHTQARCLKCNEVELVPNKTIVKLYGIDGTNSRHQSRECAICFEPPPSTNMVATSRGHVFCWSCLYKWLENDKNSSCPKCRNILYVNLNIIPIYGSCHEQGPPNINRITPCIDAPKHVADMSERTYPMTSSFEEDTYDDDDDDTYSYIDLKTEEDTYNEDEEGCDHEEYTYSEDEEGCDHDIIEEIHHLLHL